MLTTLSGPEKAWDCGCRRHLRSGSEEALIVKVIYHLNVQHPEANPTLEQADVLVATEAYDESCLEDECNRLPRRLRPS
jgi:hypothetical protein